MCVCVCTYTLATWTVAVTLLPMEAIDAFHQTANSLSSPSWIHSKKIVASLLPGVHRCSSIFHLVSRSAVYHCRKIIIVYSLYEEIFTGKLFRGYSWPMKIHPTKFCPQPIYEIIKRLSPVFSRSIKSVVYIRLLESMQWILPFHFRNSEQAHAIFRGKCPLGVLLFSTAIVYLQSEVFGWWCLRS